MEDVVEGLRRQMAVLSGRPDRRSTDRVRPKDVLAVPDPLSDILPHKGLPRGAVAVFEGANSVLVAMIAAVTRAGGQVGIVGMPAMGLLSAAEMGADLSRVAMVPDAGSDPVEVAAVLLDGMDLVVLGTRGLTVAPSRARVVTGRVRQQSSVLLVVGAWPSAQMRIDAEVLTYRHSPGSGVVDLTQARNGYGRIGGMRLRVKLSGRSRRGEEVEVDLVECGQGSLRRVELVRAGTSRPSLAVAN